MRNKSLAAVPAYCFIHLPVTPPSSNNNSFGQHDSFIGILCFIQVECYGVVGAMGSEHEMLQE